MNDYNSPQELLKAYRNGLVGVECDLEDLKKLLGELPEPMFGVAAYQLYGDGKGKISLPFRSLLKFDPGFGPAERQTTGDCQNGSDLVRMADGSTKPIKDIKIGEYVISAYGKKRLVTNIFKKPYHKKMIEISLENHTKTASTPDHKYIVDNITMKTKPIADLKVGDKVFLPKIDHVEENMIFDMVKFFNGFVVTEDIDFKKLRLEPVEKDYIRIKNSRCPIKRYIKSDEKLSWLIGLYAAEGGVDGVDNKQERITYNLGSHEAIIAEQVRQYFKEIFDVDVHIYQVPSKPTVIYARINNVLIANLFKYLVSGNTYTKSISKEFFVTTKANKLALLKGWIDGDGHQGKYYTSATSVSKQLVLDFAEIANSVDLDFSIRKQDKTHDPNRKDNYSLCLTAASSRIFNKPKTKYITTINPKTTIGKMVKIINIKVVDPEENYVYCIEVEKDHNFICNGIGINNCVAHSTRNAVDITRAVEIDIKGEPESFETRSAVEAIYQSRGHKGQGMSCSGAARYVHQKGGILLRKNYGAVDLSKYNSRLGANHLIPNSVYIDEAKKHQVKTISLIRTVAEARDALANGYAISVCSGQGFSSRRDKNGIAAASGSWAHAMAWIGCDDSREIYNETLFLVQNSWGLWNSGPKRLGQPDGSFWIRESVARSMLAANGSWVFSDVQGFPARKLPDYGTQEYL